MVDEEDEDREDEDDNEEELDEDEDGEEEVDSESEDELLVVEHVDVLDKLTELAELSSDRQEQTEPERGGGAVAWVSMIDASI